MKNAEHVVIHLPGEGRVLEMGSFRMTVKAEAGSGFTLLEAEEPPGFGPPMHVHHDAAEAFYVLAGEYRFFLDSTETRCPAGSFVLVPAGVTHGFRVGDVPSRKLNLFVPDAMLGYFEALADAEGSGRTLSPQEFEQLAAASALEVCGPVPEGYL